MNGRDVYVLAVNVGDLDKVQYALTKLHVPVNTRLDFDYNTAAHLAVQNKNKKLLSFLMDKGIDLSLVNRQKLNVIDFARECGSTECLQFLTSNVRASDPMMIESPNIAPVLPVSSSAKDNYIAAVMNNDAMAVRHAIEVLGVNVNTRIDSDLNTAAHIAVMKKNTVLLSLLISKNADLNLINRQNLKAGDLVDQYEAWECCDLLASNIQEGISKKFPEKLPEKPVARVVTTADLVNAMKANDAAKLDELLPLAANVNFQVDNEPAAVYAVRHNRVELLRVLAKYEVSLSATVIVENPNYTGYDYDEPRQKSIGLLEFASLRKSWNCHAFLMKHELENAKKSLSLDDQGSIIAAVKTNDAARLKKILENLQINKVKLDIKVRLINPNYGESYSYNEPREVEVDLLEFASRNRAWECHALLMKFETQSNKPKDTVKPAAVIGPKRQLMIEAAKANDIKKMEALFAQGFANPHLIIDDEPVLHYAVRTGKLALLDFMISKGTKIFIRRNEKTALDLAIEKGDLDYVLAFLYKTKPSEDEYTFFREALLRACELNQLKIVEVLVTHVAKTFKQGATVVSALGVDGNTCLHWAAHHANLTMVQLLLKYGYQTVKNLQSQTPYQRALKKDNNPCTAELAKSELEFAKRFDDKASIVHLFKEYKTFQDDILDWVEKTKKQSDVELINQLLAGTDHRTFRMILNSWLFFGALAGNNIDVICKMISSNYNDYLSLNSTDITKWASRHIDTHPDWIAKVVGVARPDVLKWLEPICKDSKAYQRIIAVRDGNVPLLISLFDQYTKPDFTIDGEPALHYAVRTKKLNLLNFLIQRGAVISVKHNDLTALDLAVSEQDENYAYAFLYKQQPLMSEYETLRAGLLKACELNKTKIVTTLVTHVAKTFNGQSPVSAKSANGNTCLHWAASHGNLEVLKALRADNYPIVGNNQMKTPGQLAVAADHRECAKELGKLEWDYATRQQAERGTHLDWMCELTKLNLVPVGSFTLYPSQQKDIPLLTQLHAVASDTVMVLSLRKLMFDAAIAQKKIDLLCEYLNKKDYFLYSEHKVVLYDFAWIYVSIQPDVVARLISAAEHPAAKEIIQNARYKYAINAKNQTLICQIIANNEELRNDFWEWVEQVGEDNPDFVKKLQEAAANRPELLARLKKIGAGLPEEIAEFFDDPIMFSLFKNPRIAPRGDTYDESVSRNLSLCPHTRNKLTQADFYQNKIVLLLIKYYKTAADIKQTPPALICPLSKKIFERPVVANDGETYESTALMDYLWKSNNKLPGGATFTRYYPNMLVKDLIEKMQYGVVAAPAKPEVAAPQIVPSEHSPAKLQPIQQVVQEPVPALSLEKIMELFEDVLDLDIFVDPVIYFDGRTFSKSTVIDANGSGKRDPQAQDAMVMFAKDKVVPNLLVAELIKYFKQPNVNLTVIPPVLICPETKKIYEEPVVALDGKTYERVNLTSYLESHGERLPTGQEQTRAPFRNKVVSQVIALFKPEPIPVAQVTTSSQGMFAPQQNTASVSNSSAPTPKR